MKAILPLGVVVLSVWSCNTTNSSQGANGFLVTSFTVADTLGHTVSQFREREAFDLSFSAMNTTGDTLTYHTGYPIILFEILYGDSVVAASYFGCAFPQIVISGRLAPGQTLKANWRAPKSICQSKAAPLLPGSYKAQVSFPVFDQVTVTPATPISLLIRQ
ncbi:MAG TPA: hypothetical protein VI758_07555 [Bacteroidota bacterium]